MNAMCDGCAICFSSVSAGGQLQLALSRRFADYQSANEQNCTGSLSTYGGPVGGTVGRVNAHRTRCTINVTNTDENFGYGACAIRGLVVNEDFGYADGAPCIMLRLNKASFPPFSTRKRSNFALAASRLCTRQRAARIVAREFDARRRHVEHKIGVWHDAERRMLP